MKIITVINTCLLFLLIANSGAAQPGLDTLTLHDGRQLVGTLTKYHPRRGVHFEINIPDILEQAALQNWSAGRMNAATVSELQKYQIIQLLPSMIESMQIHSTGAALRKKHTGRQKVKSVAADVPYAFRERGIYYSLKGGPAFGQAHFGDSDLGFGMAASVGYQWHRLLGVGLGLGFDNYSVVDNVAARVLPITAEVRGYFRAQPRSLYYHVTAGYGAAFKNEQVGISKATGGLLVHPALGLRMGAREDVNFTLDIGYRFQEVTLQREWNLWWGGVERQEQHIWYKRLCLRFGVLF